MEWACVGGQHAQPGLAGQMPRFGLPKAGKGSFPRLLVRGAQETWFSLSGKERNNLACWFVSACVTHSAVRTGMCPDRYLFLFQMFSPPFTFFPFFNENNVNQNVWKSQMEKGWQHLTAEIFVEAFVESGLAVAPSLADLGG